MIGWVWADGIFPPSAPLNIGFGDNIQVSRNVSLDFSLSGGVMLLTPEFIHNEYEIIGVFYPEIKLQTKWITIGLIYSRKVMRGSYSKNIYNTLLIGLSKGI